MLIRLQARDFAIVDRIGVEFNDGMTVLTGETGAGKSILVDALGLVLGERGGAQLVRSGAKRAEFSAEFDIENLPHVRGWLAEQSLDLDDECLLRRVINADGRSRAFINGNAVPVQQLKSIGEHLVDIHGQHFHQSLARKPVQRDLLDYYGELGGIANDTANAYETWKRVDEHLRTLLDNDVDRSSRLDLLTFQLQELRSLDLAEGEFERLQSERQRIVHSGRIAESVRSALTALYDDDRRNANSLVAEASRCVASVAEYDASLAAVSELLESTGIQITEAANELRRFEETIDVDPRRRDEVEERLDAIQSLSRKHRVEPQDISTLTARLEVEADELANAEVRGKELELELEHARDAYMTLAKSLTMKRKKVGKKMSDAVTDAMHGLGMPGGKFAVAVEPLGKGNERAHGIDNIEFVITANPGQAMQSLSKVASGGELSRMSLAIQVIASNGSTIPTLVFDEVDSGVGGGVAEMVGRRLADLGQSRQVLCVTHLPQVASLATHHFRIAKVTDGKSTRTTAQELAEEERIEELARMLGGVEITQKTLDHAAEMLRESPKKRA